MKSYLFLSPLSLLLVAAINYVAISEALGVSPSVLTAGLAADNVICAIYFMVLFALASKIPAEASTANGMYHLAIVSSFVCSLSSCNFLQLCEIQL